MKTTLVSMLVLGLALTACQQSAHKGTVAAATDGNTCSADGHDKTSCAKAADDDGDDDEQDVALDQVPAAVKAAALGAVPGLALKEAERETEHGAIVYTLEGTANGHVYEIEVTADGKVTEVEQKAKDDDDGDDDGAK